MPDSITIPVQIPVEVEPTLLEHLLSLLPSALTMAVVILIIVGVRYVLIKAQATPKQGRFRNQMIIMLMCFIGLPVVVLTLPVSDGTIGQLLNLMGLIFSATIALSATTFIGNVMAGMMLRIVKNFKLGDFIYVGDNFGRVTERGLFHIEIQTEHRNLTTLPALYLVTNPVKVVRASGTLVTVEVSLGYDVPRQKIEKALLKAAKRAGLEDPFVHVMKLGDFSIKYKIAGLLRELKGLISARSKLHAYSIDELHAKGIEIVSPNFMNQRRLEPNRRFIAKATPLGEIESSKELPESMLFDKADEAKSIEKLRERLSKISEAAARLKAEQSEVTGESEKEMFKEKRDYIKARMIRLEEYIEQREKEAK